MWLFSEHGFLSVVKHKYMPGCVMVRARVKEDAEDLVERLAKLGEKTSVKETPDGDYRYRVTCTKKNMARVAASLIEDMDYTNFKDRVHEKGEKDRDRAYMGVWSEMNGLQYDRLYPDRKKVKGFGWYTDGDDIVIGGSGADVDPQSWLSEGWEYVDEMPGTDRENDDLLTREQKRRLWDNEPTVDEDGVYWLDGMPVQVVDDPNAPLPDLDDTLELVPEQPKPVKAASLGDYTLQTAKRGNVRGAKRGRNEGLRRHRKAL